MLDLLTSRKSRPISVRAFVNRTVARIGATVAEFRAPAPAAEPTDLFAPDELPPLDDIRATAAEYSRAGDQARRADRGKRAARKILDRLPVGRYGVWDVERVPSGRQTADLDEIRATYKRLGLGPVPMKPSAPSLKVKKVELVKVTICAACDRTWPESDMSEDGNVDPVCCDCRQLHAALDDRAEYRAYAHR